MSRPDLSGLHATWWMGDRPQIVFLMHRTVFNRTHWLQIPSRLWSLTLAPVLAEIRERGET